MPAYDEFPWFRMWNRFVDDPKIKDLPLDLFKTWVFCLALANRNKERGKLPRCADKVGGKSGQSRDKVRTKSEQSQNKVAGLLPQIRYIALTLGWQIPATNRRINSLVERGFLDLTSEGLSIHNWDEYQPPRDTNAERQRRYRKAHQINVRNDDQNGDHNVTNNATRNVTVTPPPVTKSQRTEEESPLPPSGGSPPFFPEPLSPPLPPGGTNGSLDHWARECLGDRYDLENVGPNIHAWLRSGFPPDRIKSALVSALAKAGHGSLVRYALGCLRAPEREPVDPNAPPVLKSELAIIAMREWAKEKCRPEEPDGDR